MENSPIYALTLVVALVAALAFSDPGSDAPATAEAAASVITANDGWEPDGVSNLISGTATGAVVFSDEESLLIEITLSQLPTTTTEPTADNGSGPATTQTTATTGTTSQPPTSSSTSPTTTSTTSPTGFRPDYEAGFYARINSLRTSNGLETLTSDGSLNSYARNRAAYLGSIGKLQHSDIGSLLPPWSGAGENLAAGYSVPDMFGALAGSTVHRNIMLGDFTHVGVGVWVDDEGVLWAVHVFAHD